MFYEQYKFNFDHRRHLKKQLIIHFSRTKIVVLAINNILNTQNSIYLNILILKINSDFFIPANLILAALFLAVVIVEAIFTPGKISLN